MVGQRQPAPIRIERLASPQVRMLEPRFVLNGSTELVMAQLLVTDQEMQLVVTGTNESETVHLEVQDDGEQISLRQGERVIPIDREQGEPSDRVNRSEVGEVIFRMGLGDDTLDLQLPDGLNVTVEDDEPIEHVGKGEHDGTGEDGGTGEEGNRDRTILRFFGDDVEDPETGESPAAARIVVDSEMITFADPPRSGQPTSLEDPSPQIVTLGRDVVKLNGDVSFGLVDETTQLNIDGGLFQVDGRLVLSGDVTVVGSGMVDLSDASMTATTSQTDLRVTLQQGQGNVFQLGGADAPEGRFLVRDLTVDSAGEVNIGPAQADAPGLKLSGDLEIRKVSEMTQFDTVVDTNSVFVDSDTDVEPDSDITVNEAINTRNGQITLLTSGVLTIDGNLKSDSATEQNQAQIDLSGGSVRLIDTRLTTSGGFINVMGPDGISISRQVQVDSGNMQSAASAGLVRFLNAVQSADEVGDTLTVDARGATGNGTVEFRAPIGRSSTTPEANDLNGLIVNASQIKINSIGVLDGNVELTGDEVKLGGDQVRTSDSGDVIINGDLLLPVGDTVIASAGSAQFTSIVKGQPGTRDLEVTAGLDTLFGGAVFNNIRDLNVTAGRVARFRGDVTLDRNMTVDAGTIQVEAAVQTDGGDVQLSADRDVQFTADGDVQTLGGNVVVLADLAMSSEGGFVTMADGTLIDVQSGTIAIEADQNIELGGLRSIRNDVGGEEGGGEGGEITDAIRVVSLNGRIVDGGDQHTDIDGNQGQVRLSAATGIGDGNPLETRIGRLISRVTDTGGTTLLEDDAIVLESVVTDDGSITIASGQANMPSGGSLGGEIDGTIVALRVLSRSANDRDIVLTAVGDTSDIIVQSITAAQEDGDVMAGSDVQLIADDDILDSNLRDNNRVRADDLRLTANNLNNDANIRVDPNDVGKETENELNVAIALSTRVNDLQATVGSMLRGDIGIDEQDSIRLANSDAGAGEVVETGNGQIVIRAETKITVVDNDLSSSAEIIAGGEGHGRIDLRASELELLENVQLRAFKVQNPFPRPATETPGLGPVEPNEGDPDEGDPDLGEPDVGEPNEGELVVGEPVVGEPEESVIEIFPRDREETLAVADRSVFLKADDLIVFDEIVEIRTGMDMVNDQETVVGTNQGVAKVFAPRPIELKTVFDPVTGDPTTVKPDLDDPAQDDRGSAFFIASSINVNVLEQAAVNDATGILTLDIGQRDERGLTVNIDWGAPNTPESPTDPFDPDVFPQRFQQISGLSADSRVFVGIDASGRPTQPMIGTSGPAVLVVEHLFTQANIVDSKLNLRDASTKPLEVRFEVRHHESIRIEAEKVRQGDKSNEVAGQIVSSSDNPDTDQFGPLPDSRESEDLEKSGLENGQATFLIPSLTIPVAFIPVRDVIPEFEEREVVIRSESTVAVTQTTVETVESSKVPTISRREFFRIRVLSPEPGGPDLVPPEELPADILAGDKLKQLFSELPDGRYEIEYVLGDANQRTVLQVDVRNQIATIPGEDLEEGILRLKRLGKEAAEEAIPEQPAENESDQPPAAQTQHQNELPNEPLQRDPSEPLTASTPPLVAGLVLASAFRRHRRGRNKRLSVAARFAARGRLRNQTGSDRLE